MSQLTKAITIAYEGVWIHAAKDGTANSGGAQHSMLSHFNGLRWEQVTEGANNWHYYFIVADGPFCMTYDVVNAVGARPMGRHGGRTALERNSMLYADQNTGQFGRRCE